MIDHEFTTNSQRTAGIFTIDDADLLREMFTKKKKKQIKTTSFIKSNLPPVPIAPEMIETFPDCQFDNDLNLFFILFLFISSRSE